MTKENKHATAGLEEKWQKILETCSNCFKEKGMPCEKHLISIKQDRLRFANVLNNVSYIKKFFQIYEK